MKIAPTLSSGPAMSYLEDGVPVVLSGVAPSDNFCAWIQRDPRALIRCGESG